MLSFLIDENLPRQLGDEAQDQGHEARWVRDVLPGASDRAIFEELQSSGERLVTRDLRFANTVFARIGLEDAITGVVLIREERMVAIREAWIRYVQRDEYPRQSLAVLERHRTRHRLFSE